MAEIPDYQQKTLEEMIEAIDAMPPHIFLNLRPPSKQWRPPRELTEEMKRKRAVEYVKEYKMKNKVENERVRALLHNLRAINARIVELHMELNPDVQEFMINESIREVQAIVGNQMPVMDPSLMILDYQRKIHLAPIIAMNSGKMKTFHTAHHVYQHEYKRYMEMNQGGSSYRINERLERSGRKLECARLWEQVITMRVQAEQLKRCSEELKKSVWTNVLCKYIDKIPNFPENHPVTRRVAEIRAHYAPFSRQKLDLKFSIDRILEPSTSIFST